MKIEEKGKKLVITDFNELEAYKIARKVEKDGRWFYEKLYDKVESPKIKEALGFLLKEESNHLAFFEEQLDKMREKEEDAFEEDDLLDSLDFGVFKPYQDIKGLEEVLNNTTKALKLGVVVEDKSIGFYSACREKVSSQNTKNKLSEIIEEEKKHKETIEEKLKEYTS